MKAFIRDIKKYKFLFLLLLPGLLFYIIFCYIPMFGVVIAFQDYKITRGFFGSDWVGLKHFISFFSSELSFKLIRNTLVLNLYSLLWGFPIPIIFAIMLSEVKSTFYRKMIQTASYIPYFMSSVIAVGLAGLLLNVNAGVINEMIVSFGGSRIDFLLEPQYYRSVYVGIGIWKSFGYSSIIYLAAIIGINQELYEAATIDGANKLQRIWHITLPGIASTIIILFIMNVGTLLGSSFEMSFLLQRPLNYEVSDVIATYVYRKGIAVTEGFPNFSFATAIGFFQSVINIILLYIANFLSRRFTETSLF